MDRGKPSLLLVSPNERPDLSALLSQRGLAVTAASSSREAVAVIEGSSFDALLIELEAAGVGGSSLREVRDLAERWPDLPIVACSAVLTGTEELARNALAAGAVEYLALPATTASLELALTPALARAPATGLESAYVSPHVGLLSNSPVMQPVRERIARIAAGSSTVLVRGETGTGKELVARALHAASARAGAPFIRVHASALPDALLESELFGYERGAFTGATARKPGRVELAEGGTLFFDEIGELSPVMQVKLLRLIQEREYERLGGTRTLRADVRFVAATHRDLEHMVQERTFREDLFYRLNVVAVWLPPLRARREDIALIAQHYLRVFRDLSGKPRLQFHDDALRFLVAQRWPGNVRQLVNFVERLVVLAQHDVIGLADVQRHSDEQLQFLTQAAASQSAWPSPDAIGGPGSAMSPPAAADESGAQAMAGAVAERAASAEPLHFSSAVRPLREDVRRAEHRALLKALQYASGNKALAARMLGVSRRTLYTKLEEHGIE
jgi:two-component system response regulator AtoC